MCFPVNITKFLKTPILKTSANSGGCVTLLFYLPIIFQIHTELSPHVQLLLLRDIFCIISVDNKI